VAQAAVQPARRWAIRIATLAALLLGGFGAGFWVRTLARTAVPNPVVRFSLDLPQGESFNPT
jgi:hypothetical protein